MSVEPQSEASAGAGSVAAAGSEPPARWRAWLPQPFEICCFAGALGTLLFLRGSGALRLGWSSISFIGQSVLGILPLYLTAGLVAQVVAHVLRRESVRDYLREVVTFRWIVGWARLWLAGAAMIYAYLWLKVSIPLVRVALFDQELWQLDRALHFGISPTILAVELADGTVLASLLDRWYSSFLMFTQLSLAYFTCSTRDTARRNFLFANGALWIVGGWLYLAVPAIGPCYATPEFREPIRDEMPRAIVMQDVMFAQYGKLIRSRGGFLDTFNPSLGVAAMPSLHVGAFWLFALWAKRNERRLFLPLAVATGLTFFGSLVSTWHYAIDGYAGMFLAWLAIRLADRFEPVTRELESSESASRARSANAASAPTGGVPS